MHKFTLRGLEWRGSILLDSKDVTMGMACLHHLVRLGFHPTGLILGTFFVLTQFVSPTPGWTGADLQQYQLDDSELASIVLAKDTNSEVLRKLGRPCEVPASNHETVSYVYKGSDGNYLQFVVNLSPSDVHYRLVESMTMSAEPTIPVSCYTPSQASQAPSNGTVSKIHTGRGVQLGQSIDQIINLYGEPNEKQIVNTRELRLRFDLGYETDQFYQWTLTFRDGRLVEWNAEAIPFFIEVGG